MKYHDSIIGLLKKELEKIYSRSTSLTIRTSVKKSSQYLNQVDLFLRVRTQSDPAKLVLEVKSLKAKNYHLTRTLQNERKKLGKLIREKNELQAKFQKLEKEKNYFQQMILSDLERFKSTLPNVVEELSQLCFKRIIEYETLETSDLPEFVPESSVPMTDASENPMESCSGLHHLLIPNVILDKLPGSQTELYESPSSLPKSSLRRKRNSSGLNMQNDEDTEDTLRAGVTQSKPKSRKRTKTCNYSSNDGEMNGNCSPSPKASSYCTRSSSRKTKLGKNSSINTTEEPKNEKSMMPPPRTQGKRPQAEDHNEKDDGEDVDATKNPDLTKKGFKISSLCPFCLEEMSSNTAVDNHVENEHGGYDCNLPLLGPFAYENVKRKCRCLYQCYKKFNSAKQMQKHVMVQHFQGRDQRVDDPVSGYCVYRCRGFWSQSKVDSLLSHVSSTHRKKDFSEAFTSYDSPAPSEYS